MTNISPSMFIFYFFPPKKVNDNSIAYLIYT